MLGSPENAGLPSGPRWSPLSVLGASAALSVGTAALILLGHTRWAGVAALFAALTMLLGTVSARAGARGRRSRLPRFAELVLDRIFEACVLAPVAWGWRGGSATITALALVGLAASFVSSYERARGRALGYRGSETVGYRALRAALLVFGLLVGWLGAALWIFAALTIAAAAVRAWNVVLQERGHTGVERSG
jgi:hypothetical protein